MRRQREHFIVDGYNVINAWPELIALQKDLSEARDRLIHVLAEYGAYEKYDVTIVFDALFTSDEMHYEKVSDHLETIYTGEGETAAAAIAGAADHRDRRHRYAGPGVHRDQHGFRLHWQ